MRPLTPKTAYTPEPDEQAGVKTFVAPEGDDREREVNLPPGSATPNTPKREDQSGDGGRDLPGVRFNTPDSESGVPARSLPTPGEEYGNPSKDDYGYVRRRNLAAEDEGESDKDAYERRRPWRRQRLQKIEQRRDDRIYYLQNKALILNRVLRRYERLKRNTQFQQQREEYRENPDRFERRRADDELAAEVVRELMQKLGYTPWSLGKKRHRHRGPALQQRRRQYRRNRARARRQHHLWYQKNKNKPAFKRRQKMRRRNPSRFRLRPASVLTVPEIAFVVGREMQIGYVHSVSPMTGLVTVVLDGPVLGGSSAFSMPTMVFLNAVVFLTPEDADAAFELIDVEVGEDAYADLDPEGVRQCAALYGVDPESSEFQDVCRRILGDMNIEDASADDLSRLTAEIVGDSIGAWGDRSTEDPDDHLETHLIDPRDDNVYYGEVNVRDARARRVASRYLAAAETFVLERTPPGDLSQNWLGDGREAPPREKEDLEKRPVKETAPDQWTADPKPTHTPTPPDSATSPSEDYYGGGSGKVIPDNMRMAATIDDIARRTAPDVLKRAKGVKVRLSRADPSRGIWTFAARGSEGRTYTIRFKAERKGNVRDVSRAQVRVSCDCDFFRWQGPEHWARANKYLYGKPRGTASTPRVKDPDGKHWACKHVLAALNLARNYRFAAHGDLWPAGADVMPDFEGGPSAKRVAARYGAPEGG